LTTATSTNNGRGRVVVVGNLTIDDVVQPDGRTAMGTLGGNTVHSATAALACGADVAVVTRKGEDFSPEALDALAAAGIDVSGVVATSGPTVRNWVVYEHDGRRRWLYRTPAARSAEVAPQPQDLNGEVLRGAAVVHVAAMPLLNAERVVAAARALAPGARITLDTHEDWVAPVRDRLLALASAVDLFVPSLEELQELTSTRTAEDGLRALAEAGLTAAVVKAGADGAYLLQDGAICHLPALVTDPVDTTGAGDAFCGGLAAGLATGSDLLTATALGAAAAGVAIRSSGSLRLLDPSVNPAVLRQDGADLAARAVWVTRAARPVVATVRSLTGESQPSSDAYQIDVMRREIAMIPDVVADAVADADGHLAALAKSLVAQDISHLWLTGCGDSAFAGQAAALAFLRHTGITPHAAHALDLARYDVRYLPPGSAVLGVSFSGKVGRTTEAIVQSRRFGHPTYALTNDPAGQMGQASEVVVPLDVTTLGFSPGTSTYVAMLGNLLRLAAALAELTQGDDTLRRQLDQLPGWVQQTLAAADEPSVTAAERLLGQPWVTFLGAGPNEATARFGAAKLFEGPQQLGVSTNLEEWAHEEYFVTTAGTPVVLVNPTGAGHDRGLEILSELRFVGADAVVVTDAKPPDSADDESGRLLHLPLSAGVPEELSPVTASLPLALMGFHLARLAGKQSYNFPNEAARTEHYDTIHRATIGDPA
jgi:sugar/nucleoside kinase (ribokinase family)/fructoselysine-6-P-deglycase FrlB-like protein